jgi:hypothetical protein
MGCISSTGKVTAEEKKLLSATGIPEDNLDISPGDYKLVYINEKSPRVRLDLCDELIELPIRGDGCSYNIKYCFISQRGYYPNAMGKANQDSYAICENLLGDSDTHLFGIFDGHGEYGDLCSYFAAQMVRIN